ncbi:MAG: hypothetical protein FWC08_03825 [Defluviitaleaceae bacterium]|nr:hypothetical protein [Defluviitaleaceae bacterium]
MRIKNKLYLVMGIALTATFFVFATVQAWPFLFENEILRVAGVYEIVPDDAAENDDAEGLPHSQLNIEGQEPLQSAAAEGQNGASATDDNASGETDGETEASEEIAGGTGTETAFTVAQGVSVAENGAVISENGLIINQMYAGGDTGNNAVSHSFVEIFNTTDGKIYIGNYSVQIQTPGDPGSGGYAPAPPIPWNVVELSGYMEPRSSFLIVSTFGESTAENHRVLENWDIKVDYEFGNRGLSVALVSHQEPLPAFITENCGVIDLLGAINTGPPRDRSDNYLVAPARISRSQGVRRVNFENTNNNEEDFHATRYMELDDAQWQELRPRYSGDGEWTVAAAPVVRAAQNLPRLFINQIHGQGSPGTNAVSHGFIELYNPSNEHVNLRGLSLQVANGTGIRPWNVLELPNFIMRPHTSFLVVSTEWYNDNTNMGHIPEEAMWHRARYVIRNWDMEWDLRFNNSNMVVALVCGAEPLSDEITENEWYGIIDLVGVHNNSAEDTAHYRGSGPAGNISRQASVRRVNFRRSTDNARNFARVDFRYPSGYDNRTRPADTNRDGISNDELETYRPRYSGDGEWRPIFRPISHVTIRGGGMNYYAYPSPAAMADSVRLNAGTPPDGKAFLEWTTTTPGVTIRNATSPTDAAFFMPDRSVVVTANFFTPVTYGVIIIGGGEGYRANPNPAQEGATVTLNAGTSPAGKRFAHWYSDDVTITNPTQQTSATFTMPPRNITVTAYWEEIPADAIPDIVLMELTRTESNATAGEGNQFNATGGLFQNVSNLTAWSGGYQRIIGFRGTNRAPIAFNNFNPGWRSVNPSVGSAHLDYGITVDTATAFQISFETTGHDNIRFSARQRSTGSGPDFFALAYRVGSDGEFTSIPDTRNAVSLQNTHGFRNNIYEDLDWPHSQTFDSFRLPSAAENQAAVYLRVYMRESGIASTESARRGGNTSINDIVIMGDEMSGYAPERFNIAVTGGGEGYRATPNPATENATVFLYAGAAAAGTRFVNWTSEDVDITNPSQQNGASFTMPAVDVTVTANWETVAAGTEITLMELVRTEYNAAADSGNQFNATGGLFRNVSNLTAWSGNVQRVIGYVDTNRAPVVFNNFDDPGWRSVNPTVGADHLDHGVTVDTATAFQIRFETTGHENIRFSARQRSTGSGPDFFALAYRIGSEGGFTSISGTRTSNRQAPAAYRNNAYSDFNWANSQTFDRFRLPASIADEAVVYLRVYMRESNLPSTDAARQGGNTSINDIIISGDELGAVPPTFDITVMGGGVGHSASPNPAEAGAVITLNAGTPPTGAQFVNWTSYDVTIWDYEMQNGATFTMPAADVTVTANWEFPQGETDVVLMAMTRLESSLVFADQGNQINATGGVFQSVSNLQAFSENQQVLIGSLNADNALAPVAFRNQSNVDGRGWRGVGTMAEDAGITADTASAWQVRFSTEGFENIRFSAQQRSTGSGPDGFALAYRIGSTGSFTPIAGSERRVFRGGAGDPSVFVNAETHSFIDFELPAAVQNQEVVYLRVYAYGLTITARPNGNTSINNIVIMGDALAVGAMFDPGNLPDGMFGTTTPAALMKDEE